MLAKWGREIGNRNWKRRGVVYESEPDGVCQINRRVH